MLQKNTNRSYAPSMKTNWAVLPVTELSVNLVEVSDRIAISGDYEQLYKDYMFFMFTYVPSGFFDRLCYELGNSLGIDEKKMRTALAGLLRKQAEGHKEIE